MEDDDILHVELIKPDSFVERYFERYTYRKEDHLDQYVCMHRNGLCMIGLEESHKVVTQGIPIDHIDWCPGKTDRMSNKFSGGKKKGAQFIGLAERLCEVVLADSTRVPIYTGVKGSLIEINSEVVKDPSLMQRDPCADGWLAILKPPGFDGKKALIEGAVKSGASLKQ